MADQQIDLSYLLNHMGENRDQYHGAITPPLFQTSNFAFPTVDAFSKAIGNEGDTYIYTRGRNPTVDMLCEKLAAMEGADDALVLASGSAAIATAVISQVQKGDHVVCVQHPYTWTHKLLYDLLARFGVSATLVDGKDTAAIEAALRPETRLIYLESPNSMMMELQDLEQIGKLARALNIVTVIDNSYATALVQKPMDFGIDLVVYSATKYLAGHSDVVAGVICGRKERMQALFDGDFLTLGACISPFNAWLMLRSLRTLPLRIQRSSDTTREIVRFLEAHPAVQQVLYPFSAQHPQYELAQRQMEMPMGLFSILLNTEDPAALERFSDSLQTFLMAVSWGGHESLQFPAIALHKALPEVALPINLVRLYVGLEDPRTLIRDLENGLSAL